MTALSIYDIPLQRVTGEATTLAEYRGQVLLVVNVASKCGLTPQYAGLERLYATSQQRGLTVLGFPCNDFAAQEPGSEADIQAFCETSYGVRFPLFAKVNINSSPRHPLYSALIAAQPSRQSKGDVFAQMLAKHNLLPRDETDVMWNFEKFLVGRDGAVVARFAPDMTVENPLVLAAIEAALSQH
jgi:glutathione peroxidase